MYLLTKNKQTNIRGWIELNYQVVLSKKVCRQTHIHSGPPNCLIRS